MQLCARELTPEWSLKLAATINWRRVPQNGRSMDVAPSQQTIVVTAPLWPRPTAQSTQLVISVSGERRIIPHSTYQSIVGNVKRL